MCLKKKRNYSGITNCYCLALVPQSPKLGDLCAGWCCFTDCHLGILENWEKMRGYIFRDEDAFLWLKLTAALEVKAHLGIRYILQVNSNVLNHQYNQQYYFWKIKFEQRAVMLRPSGFFSFCSLEIMENGVLVPCRQSISLKMPCKTGRTLHFHLKSVFILKM